MGRRARQTCEERLEAYIAGLASVIGHAARVGPLHRLLSRPDDAGSEEECQTDGGVTRRRDCRRSIVALAFRRQVHWSDEKVLAKVLEMVLPGLERHGAIRAWIIDDTVSQAGPPFRRRRAAILRAARQTGQLPGRRVAVAGQRSREPAGGPSPLPAPGVDRRRWAPAKAGVHVEIAFKTKPQIALDQIRWAYEAGLRAAWC